MKVRAYVKLGGQKNVLAPRRNKPNLTGYPSEAPAASGQSLAEAAGRVAELAVLLPDELAPQRDRIISLAASAMIDGEFPQHMPPEHEQQSQGRD
ncbi:MAG TPA: hypothetical protein VLG16_02015 [Candidatus Saccharimonadales bacterium]|nr:hypothetical protein [Candidatus Saccharimonadales bacterium]